MYFFSFIYNMLKCQKEEKGFCKTQKYELQLLPATCCFQKNELELFLEDWPRRPPSSPDASGLPAFPPLSSIFFTSFPFSVPSIFQFLCRQLTYTACNTSSLVLPVVRTLRFHHFSFEAFSFFRKSLRLLPASAGRHLTRSILTNSQARTSRSGLPAITSDISYLLNIQKSDTHIRLCRPASLNHQPFPQTPSAISRCLRATSFPLHFTAAFHSSNIPFFLFSFFHPFSFSLFFLSSFPFFFFSSLYYF